MNKSRALLAAAMLFVFGTVEFLSANNFVFISRTANGYTLGLPAYEKRSILVTMDDRAILYITRNMLAEDVHWSSEPGRDCTPEPPRTLFCALKTATEMHTGKFNPRQPALQHVRFAIEDRFPRRWTDHRLADFNSDPDTTHLEVVTVIDMARNAVTDKFERISEANRRLGRTE